VKLEPGRVLERYRVERFLGEGGFSFVYQVRHLALDTDFALKLLKIDRSDLHERLLQEGRIQAKLDHPNVISVRDVIEVDGSPGLVLDLVQDGNLEDLLDRRRPPVEEIDDLAQGILQGVAAAHAIGLVHRDLKPSNVLLALTPGGPVPKVSDFGLARVLMPDADFGTSATRSGIMMGTPYYMAPEQIENASMADARSDVFALGSLLYELACGQVAFDGSKLADILFNVANVRYRPLDAIVPDLPERMLRTVAAALQEDPSHSIQTARDMLAMWRGEVPTPAVVSMTMPGRDPASFEPDGDRRTLVPRVGSASPGLEAVKQMPMERMVLVSASAAALTVALVLTCFGGLRSGDGSGPRTPPELADDARQRPPAPRVPAPAENPVAARSEPPPGAPSPVQPAPEPAPVAAANPAGSELTVAEAPEGSDESATTKGVQPRASVHVAGRGVERANLVRRADGSTVASGAGVPVGLYDLVVWFADEPAVPVELGLRLEAGMSVDVTCDADFYTCDVEGSP